MSLAGAHIDDSAMHRALIPEDQSTCNICHMNKVSEVLPAAFYHQRKAFLQPAEELPCDDGVCTLGWVPRAVNHEESESQRGKAIETVVRHHLQLTHVL